MLSIGGATYTEGGFTSSAAAVTAAQNVWAMFGPAQAGSTANRPFGAAVVDGFDFDFESSTQNMAPFAQELRSLMSAATAAGGKSYYLSAAPQCPYPDVADNDMLSGAVSFDFISVQFYNNYCGVNTFVAGDSTQPYYDFGTWDTWAKTVSANPSVKVLVGIPANTGAAGSGYTTGSALASVIAYSETYSSFGGVMMWDMSQLYENPGFLDAVVADLGSGGGSLPTTTATPTSSTASGTTLTTSTTTSATACVASYSVLAITTTTVVPTVIYQTVPVHCPISSTSATATPAATSTSTPVQQWGQCGGTGYTGSTVCASPYSCSCISVWWCQCE